MTEEHLLQLLADMDLDEKIYQLLQLPSYFFDGANSTGPAAEMGLPAKACEQAGSCLSVIGAKKLRTLQQQAMQMQPHHIPMLFMADIINGYQTLFPIPLAQGCTFDPELIEECASIAAREASASGLHVTFSPMADLVRDPRWGRVMESTGEDPYLNGKMAEAMVYGYQGRENDLTQPGKLAACLKHFAGYGAPEGGRDYNTVELSERTLREDYLPAYQKAIQAGCALTMTSFNTLGRVPSSANRWLLQDLLRDEMGFDGVVISDWAAIEELLYHRIASSAREAAKLAIQAGVDIDMATSIYAKELKHLILEGSLSEELLDQAVLRVLTLKNKLGLFENPIKDGNPQTEKELLLCQEHRNAACKCAEESFVLLKNNEEFLPLKKGKETVAFIGPFVDNHLVCGSWSFFGDDADNITLQSAVETLYPNEKVLFASGCTTVNPETTVLAFQKTPPSETLDLAAELEIAVAAAKKADKVILALGEHREFTGEAASRTDLTLPTVQLELLNAIYEVNPQIGIVLFGGRPLILTEVEKKAQAILEVWLPGTESGTAIAKTLYGDVCPSGKLSMSFPYSIGQIPVYYNHLSTGRPFSGDFQTQRYGSKYIDTPNEPLYPFGHGLSYTLFSYSPVTLNTSMLLPSGTLQATVTLTNTGRYTGTEIVQLYLQDLAGSTARPCRELKGFQRITLAPGASQNVTFTIIENMLRFYDINMKYVSEPGAFKLYIGSSSNTENSADFTLYRE